MNRLNSTLPSSSDRSETWLRDASDGAPLPVLRVVQNNAPAAAGSDDSDGRNLDDSLYLNDRLLEAKNEWLYHYYMIMQEPQKRLQIYKV